MAEQDKGVEELLDRLLEGRKSGEFVGAARLLEDLAESSAEGQRPQGWGLAAKWSDSPVSSPSPNPRLIAQPEPPTYLAFRSTEDVWNPS